MSKTSVSPAKFHNFGDLLKYLRRRNELTQLELAQRVGYSDTQISRLEHNQRVPDAATLSALFVPALHLEREPEWTARLLELANQARRDELPASESAQKPVPQNNLPAFLTTFIGRAKEQAVLLQLISEHRLVTLTGSGGIGKTRLAVQLGEQQCTNYADGVWLVEFAPLGDPGLLAQRVASSLGMLTRTSTVPYTELLTNFLRDKSALLIFDNCEHLIDACALLADTLLRQCPQLKIIATSREALGIQGELQYRVPSLRLPDIQDPLAKITEYESVRLFLERAQLALPDFRLTTDNAASVAQICSRLDGIPLALELAAARVNILTPAQIAERLDDRFNLLKSGSRAALPRQQTMRASIDWSWDLISAAERTLLQRLTVFAGGWTLRAAESVCSEPGTASNVFDLLSRLVSKSLVIASPHTGREQRFYLHETIKQYAHETLSNTANHKSDEQNIRNRHLHYFLEFSRQAQPALRGPHQLQWHDRLTLERHNIRAALEHSIQSDLKAGMYLTANVLELWYSFDASEGLSLTTALLQAPGADQFPHARASAQLTRGNILWNIQQFADARTAAQESLQIFRALGDRQGECDSLMLLGRALQFLEGMHARTEYHKQALALARSLNDVWRQADALSMLGWDQRDPRQGRAYWEEAIELLRQCGDWMYLANTLGILGFTILSNGDVETAEKLLDEAYTVNQRFNNGRDSEFILTGKSQICLLRGEYAQARALMQKNCEILKQVGNRMGYLWGSTRLAQISMHEGNLLQAHQILQDAIQKFQADQNKNGLAFALDNMAILNVLQRQYHHAPPLIGWSDATRRAIGDPRQPLQQNELDQSIATLIKKLGRPAYQQAYTFGSKMSLDQAVQSALASPSPAAASKT